MNTFWINAPWSLGPAWAREWNEAAGAASAEAAGSPAASQVVAA